MWFLPPVYWAMQRFRPGLGAAVLLPSSVLRFLTFKLQWDLQQIPAMHELARVALRVLFNGDVSQWDRAIQMPHYSTQSMPAISLHTAMHLIQVRPLTTHGHLVSPGSCHCQGVQTPATTHTLLDIGLSFALEMQNLGTWWCVRGHQPVFYWCA